MAKRQQYYKPRLKGSAQSGLGAELTPASVQRTHGSVIQANSVVVPLLQLPVGNHRYRIQPPR
eukprot:1542147-Prorocentrum_lima.AAC.1